MAIANMNVQKASRRGKLCKSSKLLRTSTEHGKHGFNFINMPAVPSGVADAAVSQHAMVKARDCPSRFVMALYLGFWRGVGKWFRRLRIEVNAGGGSIGGQVLGRFGRSLKRRGSSDFVLCFGVWGCVGRCFGFWVVLWMIVFVFGLLCFRDYCIGFWQVLCVLWDLRVEMLGGLRIEVKV